MQQSISLIESPIFFIQYSPALCITPLSTLEFEENKSSDTPEDVQRSEDSTMKNSQDALFQPEPEKHISQSIAQLASQIILNQYYELAPKWKIIALQISAITGIKHTKEEVKKCIRTYQKFSTINSSLLKCIDQRIIEYNTQYTNRFQNTKRNRRWGRISNMICSELNVNLDPVRIRERYINVLDPKIGKSRLNSQEKSRIIELKETTTLTWEAISKTIQSEFQSDSHKSPNSLKAWYNKRMKKLKNSLENSSKGISQHKMNVDNHKKPKLASTEHQAIQQIQKKTVYIPEEIIIQEETTNKSNSFIFTNDETLFLFANLEEGFTFEF